MEARPVREFESAPAVRTKVPLWIGLVGAAGSGKTMSALRLAMGMERVYGKGTFVIDTESRRSAHYADQFSFSLVDFKPPFGPLDYLAAIEHCVSKGAKIIIIDSMSHEWEGQGGVLESHDVECDRLAKQWGSTRDKVQMTAWQRPKSEHRKLIQSMLQLGVNFVLCYRAREKLKVIPGKAPQPLGWQPVAPDDVVFEATMNALLYPGSGGVPSWQPDEMGEKALVKLPGQFKDIFATRAPLSEDIGAKLATWAAGGTAPSKPANDAPTPPTNARLKDLNALMEGQGVTEPAGKLAWISNRVGRPIKSSKELTADEVEALLTERQPGQD